MIPSTNRMTENGPVTAVITMGGKKYDSASFVVPNGTSNFSCATEAPSAGNCFNNIKSAYFAEISCDQDITIKLNSTDNDPISLDKGDFPWRDMHIELTDIFITNNSGEAATVKILLF